MTFVGIEHLKPEIVAYFNKYPRPAQWKDVVEKSIRIMRENNVLIGGSVILGAPMETREDAENCIDWLYRIGVDVVNTNELEYVYGSQLWIDMVNKGLIPRERLHIRVSEVLEKDYLQDLYATAWNRAINNIETMVSKVLAVKKDKTTCLNSAFQWLSRTQEVTEAHDGYGYGKRDETICGWDEK